MADVKVTRRDILNTILATMADNSNVVDFCTKELAALDRKAEKSATASAEKNAAYDGLRTLALDVLAGSPDGLTVTDIIKNGGLDVTNQKLTYALRKCVDDKTVTKKTVKGKVYYSISAQPHNGRV